jgi:hypothetical protein
MSMYELSMMSSLLLMPKPNARPKRRKKSLMTTLASIRVPARVIGPSEAPNDWTCSIYRASRWMGWVKIALGG